MRCRRKVKSGSVLEVEYYNLPDGTRMPSDKEPRPLSSRTDEQRADDLMRRSLRRFIRIVNANFNRDSWYVTLTYRDDVLPASEGEARKELDKYIRRLQYAYPSIRIVAVTGRGDRSGRLHHHLIIDGIGVKDITDKWLMGDVARVEQLRAHNYILGVDCGEDYTGLATYLHGHAQDRKGKRWKQTRTVMQPDIQPAKECKRECTPDKPTKIKGYRFCEVHTTDWGYVCYKYISDSEEISEYNRYRARADARARTI